MMVVLRSRHSSLKEFERNEFFHSLRCGAELAPCQVPKNWTFSRKDLWCRLSISFDAHALSRTKPPCTPRRHVTGFSDAKMTRAGDFYQETIKGLGQDDGFYGDVIVMPISSRARRTSREMGELPDHQRRAGWGEHQTQISQTCIPFCAKKVALRIEMAGGR